MRKLGFVFAILFVCTTVCGCNSKNCVDVEGIANFKLTEGYYELNAHILPSEDFLSRFPYSSAQYNHRQLFKNIFSVAATECSLIVMHYDAVQYNEAKSYCLLNMDLLNSFEYNDYTFAENIRLAIGQDRIEDNKVTYSQEWFNMFAFNDNQCCLVFIGAYIPDGIDNNTKTDANAWGEFLQHYFSDFYNF